MIEINNTTRSRINAKKIREIAEKFLETYRKKDYTVSLAVVGDAQMKNLNRDYRGIDKITDVLSFPGDKKEKYLGEIIIDIRETERAGKYREMLEEIGLEVPQASRKSYLFYFLFIHGLLHLVGFDDETEKDRLKMLKKGKDFLNTSGKVV